MGQHQTLSNYHHSSLMTPGQVQEYIDLLCAKVAVLGELYVVRQMAWAVAELERVGKKVEP